MRLVNLQTNIISITIVKVSEIASLRP